ncbi:exonuclease 3'-5' domain-containing protein 1 [Schistosoma japonicum]|nr:exonuclease 3'-5' domain-containing protein 1 [Schistosoma japonicum]KAH8869927.1 exonuclease 3'-5' domain-containing protein 1 [Schistosoma japonicum]
MMNDPSHKAMLYFLEVLMNSDSPITVDQLAARFSHKSFSMEMRNACGGGSPDGLREFLQRYPSLFNIKPNGQVTSVAIELPGVDSNFDCLSDQESCSLRENGQKSLDENLSDSSSSLRNLPVTVNSNYSSKTCPASIAQKKYAYNRSQSSRKPNSTNFSNNDQLSSPSCLSLASSQPINTSSESPNLAKNSLYHSSGRNKLLNNFVSVNNNIPSYDSPVTTTSNNNNNNNSNNSNDQPTRGASLTYPSTLRTKISNIYQPPQLRKLEHASSFRLTSNCDLCSSSSNITGNTNSSNNALLPNHHEMPTMTSRTCVHCPLIELTCHHHTHHCATSHHHASSTHCHCTTTPLPASPSASLFHHIHHPIHYISPAQTTLRSSSVLPSSYYNISPMEKFILESEAVHFFQQKLIKREERWIPIKSLAGHLSQASPEVRAIVGPQLEFRHFLLKHPHVFEVQGDLVSIKDPFATGFGLKRSRDRLSATHASHSSTNISNASQSYLTRNITYERNPRPKSLILPNAINFGHFSNVSDNNGSFNTPSSPSIQWSKVRTNHRRSAHFLVDSSTIVSQNKEVTHLESVCSESSEPTGLDLVLDNANRVQTEKVAVDKVTNNIIDKENYSSNGVSSSTLTTENDPSILTGSLSSVKSNTLNSVSLTMSANEYRAIMFLRKVLEKHGGAPGQLGLNLHDLMHFLTNKAPETVQTTIGWTKIELEEFLSQHNIFFEVKSIRTSTNNTTNGSVDKIYLQMEQCQQQPLLDSKVDTVNVCNKRLNRMINIIITASKPTDLNGVRTLTNRCGKIFHVAKLWGIIDLGKHEHVFFDKSIFRHVDDLQKHFKIDELLYFNAVLAPKESRAKWRATNVWKECDRENVEKFGGLSHMRKLHPLTSNRNNSLIHNAHNSSTVYQKNGLFKNPKGNIKCGSREIAVDTMDQEGNVDTTLETAADDDTEVEDDIEDFVVETSTHKDSVSEKPIQNRSDNDSDLEYALGADEEIDDDEEEPIISPTAHDEGLHLPIDIKFIADEVEEEMERVLNFKSKHNRNKNGAKTLSNSKSACLELCDSCHSTELSSQTQSEPCYIKDSNKHKTISNVDQNRHHSLVTSSTGYDTKLLKDKSNYLSKEDSGTSSSLSEMSAVSIAVQTVSTGDIMATQLYHDNKS